MWMKNSVDPDLMASIEAVTYISSHSYIGH